MKRRTTVRAQRPLCAEMHEDDGVDPRRFFRHDNPRGQRKTWQLCRQVMRALAFLLGGACGDVVLRELVVQAVIPAPDCSRLLVRVYLGPTPVRVPPEEISARLDRARPYLRQEVAAVICRKRAPDLIFEVGPGPARSGGEVQS